MRLRPGTPVLARGPASVQVGLARPLVLEELTRAQVDWVAALEGPESSVLAHAEPHRELEEALRHHGVLTERPADSPRADVEASVRIHHAGPLALGLARALARTGLTSLVLADAAPTAVEAPGTYAPGAPGITCAAAAAWTLRGEIPHLRWGDAGGNVDVEVIIAMGSAPPTLTTPMMARERPHLLVLTDEEGVTIGPLVRPGLTPCARCLDLHRTDADAAWPRIASQCGVGRRPWVDSGSIDVAAGLAAREILATIEQGRSIDDDSLDPTVGRQWRVPARWHERDEPSTWGASAHPECGCGAAGPPGDEVTARRARFSVVSDHTTRSGQ